MNKKLSPLAKYLLGKKVKEEGKIAKTFKKQSKQRSIHKLISSWWVEKHRVCIYIKTEKTHAEIHTQNY